MNGPESPESWSWAAICGGRRTSSSVSSSIVDLPPAFSTPAREPGQLLSVASGSVLGRVKACLRPENPANPVLHRRHLDSDLQSPCRTLQNRTDLIWVRFPPKLNHSADWVLNSALAGHENYAGDGCVCLLHLSINAVT
jgi:hypothetical protein